MNLSTVQALPKAVLHDHLDGGLRPLTILELAEDQAYLGLPADEEMELKAWFHQSDKLPCYTYDETCSRCRQPISLEGEPQWLPEAL